MSINLLKGAIIFALGAAGGSLVTWKLVKSKYEDLANEEIAEYREIARNKIKEFENKIKVHNSIVEDMEDEIGLYKKVISDNGYDVYSNVAPNNYTYKDREDANLEDDACGETAESEEKPPAVNEKPKQTRIISREEFEEQNDYYVIHAQYFMEDQKFSNEQNNEIIEYEDLQPVVNIIMKEFITSPSQTLYVRNYKEKTDYAIDAYSGSYEEIILGYYYNDEEEGRLVDDDDYD